MGLMRWLESSDFNSFPALAVVQGNTTLNHKYLCMWFLMVWLFNALCCHFGSTFIYHCPHFIYFWSARANHTSCLRIPTTYAAFRSSSSCLSFSSFSLCFLSLSISSWMRLSLSLSSAIFCDSTSLLTACSWALVWETRELYSRSMSSRRDSAPLYNATYNSMTQRTTL